MISIPYNPVVWIFSDSAYSKEILLSKTTMNRLKLKDGDELLLYFLDANSARLFNGLTLGFLILAVNGLLTFLGLMLISRKQGA